MISFCLFRASHRGCFGWIFDSELLDPKTVPVNVTHHGKCPGPGPEVFGDPGLSPVDRLSRVFRVML